MKRPVKQLRREIGGGPLTRVDEMFAFRLGAKWLHQHKAFNQADGLEKLGR